MFAMEDKSSVLKIQKHNIIYYTKRAFYKD